MNSPKNTPAYQVRADQQGNEQSGTDLSTEQAGADRPDQDQSSDTDNDPSAEPLLGARHAEDEEEEEDEEDEEVEVEEDDDDASGDLQQGK